MATKTERTLSAQAIKILHHRDIDGWKWPRIAASCNVTVGVAKGIYNRVYRRLEDTQQRADNAVEFTDPEKVGQLVALSAGRIDSLKKVLEDNGFPYESARQVVDALVRNYPNVFTAVAEVKTEKMLELLDTGARKAAEAIVHRDLTFESPRDLAVITGVLIDKARLLRNQPTQILSVHERRELRSTMAVFMLEAQKRGITLDQDPTTGRTVVLDNQPSER